MAATTKIIVIVDSHGHVLAADLARASAKASKGDGPNARLVPREDQRVATIEVPREVLQLPGPALTRYFSEVRISCPADVQLPKIKIVKMHRD